MKVFSGLRPDITAAQIGGILLAGIPVVANLLHAFGVYTVSVQEQHALTEAVTWGSVSAGTLFLADAHLRGARNKAAAVGATDVGTQVGDDPPPLNQKPIPPAEK